MHIPEQFKTGWLSELPSDIVAEPCQLQIKRGQGDICYENRTITLAASWLASCPYNPENSRIATPEPAGPAENIEDVKENLAF